MAAFQQYLSSIEQNLRAGNATEHTHRPAFKTLLESIDGVTATNEPRRISCGAPDFIVSRGEVPLGYVEAKDVGRSLVEALRTDQLKRYLDSLDNLILTDYLEFRWFVRGEHRLTVRLADVSGDGNLRRRSGAERDLTELLQAFLHAETPIVKTPRALAERLAALARLIRNSIDRAFSQEEQSGTFHSQLEGFREVLLHTLKPDQFADMYAQTICYGLFAARVNKPDDGTRFTREHAAYDLPRTNPFLRNIFQQIAGPDLDERIAWAVDDVAELLNRSDMDAILRDFGRRTRQQDPVVHFYETFLAAYDPALREQRGVYYTPEPVVSYIVRSVDHLLQNKFALGYGLADEAKTKVEVRRPHRKTPEAVEMHRVQVLDPATGTGTFLFSVIDKIRERFEGNEGMWSSYVSQHLLPRIYGFEFLMAPYTIAHMKLGLQLRETGYDFATDERLRVYLTNTLEEAHEYKGLPLFTQWLADEANAAVTVKEDLPILVVLGNPPYANYGQMNNLPWISKLMEDWKPQGERKWNPDDFMKFMRWAQWRLEKTGQGILAFITSRTYLEGITHRTMRERLMDTFDDIYLLDLHGDIYEQPPEDVNDQNVFDITKGVAIGIFVKKPGTSQTPHIRYAELWDTRAEKYEWLSQHDVSTTSWRDLTEVDRSSCLGDFYFFAPRAFDNIDEYRDGWSIAEVFHVHQNALKTDRDALFLDFEKTPLRDRIVTFFTDAGIRAPFSEQYRVEDSSSYPILTRRESTSFSEENIQRCLYRPFDWRWLYYDPNLTSRPAWTVMKHMLAGSNMGFITTRQTRDKWDILATRSLCGHKSVAAYDINTLFPLYLYPDADNEDLFSEVEEKRPNLSSEFIQAVEEKLGLAFIADGEGDLENEVGPEDVFYYAYAIFHSPIYRERYAEFLKIDFPRLPLTSELDLFRELRAKGKTLVGLHLLEEGVRGPFDTNYPVAGDNEVESGHPKYFPPGETVPGTAGEVLTKGRVYINSQQYFENIEPDVWEFYVGGYQVLEKWLKDRRGRELTYEDLTHYQQVVAALQETIRVMDETDELIEAHGGWPLN